MLSMVCGSGRGLFWGYYNSNSRYVTVAQFACDCLVLLLYSYLAFYAYYSFSLL